MTNVDSAALTVELIYKHAMVVNQSFDHIISPHLS